LPPDHPPIAHAFVACAPAPRCARSRRGPRGNKKRAAELLGLKRTTFLEKMKRLELEDAPEEEEGG